MSLVSDEDIDKTRSILANFFILLINKKRYNKRDEYERAYMKEIDNAKSMISRGTRYFQKMRIII